MEDSLFEEDRRTHYQILGVAANADLADIKQAFVSLARRYHPDRCVDNNKLLEDDQSSGVPSFHRIQEAWNCLQDASQRQQYDQSLYIQRQLYQSKRSAAIPIHIQDCHTSPPATTSGCKDDAEEAPLYYTCRCGQELNVHDEVQDLLDCTACSLVYDTSQVFQDATTTTT
jgi:hypothetical protein